MRDLFVFVRLMGHRTPWILAGGGLALLTLLSGIALLTLSGWFITATALTGLGGAGAIMAFNVLIPSAGIRALAVTRIASRYAERLVTHEATFRILADVRVWFFERVIPLSPSQIADVRSGDVLSRITSDISALDNLYLRILTPTAVAAIAAAVFFLTVSLFSAGIAAAALACLALAGVGAPLLAQRLGIRPGRAITNRTSRLRTKLLDAFHGLGELISYGAVNRKLAEIETESDRLLAARGRMSHISGLAAGLTIFSANLAVVAVLWLGIPLVSNETLGAAGLALLVLLSMAAFEAVMPLSAAFQHLSRTQSAAARILDLADADPLTPDPEKGQAAIPNNAVIELDTVTFAYPKTQNPVLREVSLTLEPGTWTALVGPSGSGKTSLLNLCLRFYDPTDGQVRMGGADIKRMTRASLYRRIGYLSQRTELFSATIRDNILLGSPHADARAVERAVRLAGLDSFVAAQPDGLDTWVGEDGVLVSGGQARRIALARVILKDAPVLLLDEPTEGLDRETEAEILKALQDFGDEKAVLLVTHRPGLLAGVNQVFRLEDGRLIETGHAV